MSDQCTQENGNEVYFSTKEIKVWDGNDGDPAKFWLYSLQTENYIKSYD
jgi:hypothetical protein